MNKLVFWASAIILGFVNPLISFGLLVLYYLPGIMNDLSLSNSNEFNQDSKFMDYKSPYQMKSFSKDTLEESR
jgi:hypothetical protein